MGAVNPTERIADLPERADGEPRRRNVHFPIESQASAWACSGWTCAGSCKRPGLNIEERAIQLRKRVPGRIGGLRQTAVLFRSIKTATQIERRRALPSVDFVPETELIQQAGRNGPRPSHAVKRRFALHIA